MTRKLALSFLAAAVLALGVLLTHASAAPSSSDRWIVKLYSDSQVVGTWEAVDPGRVDGGSLVFTIRGFAEDAGSVRISGTYSVEPKKK